MRFLRLARYALLSAMAMAGWASAQQTGGITGKIPLPAAPAARIAVEKYSGSLSGKVAPAPPAVAGVWLEAAGLKAPVSPARLVLSQKEYQFARSLVVVARGTTVEFPNEDDDYHNVFSFSRAKKFEIGRYKKNEAPAPTETFDTAGLVRLQCEIHEHMRAFLLVVDSPHYTTSDAAGSFKLTGVPPGTYTLRAQMDEKHQWSIPVTVTAGRTTTAVFPSSPLAKAP